MPGMFSCEWTEVGWLRRLGGPGTLRQSGGAQRSEGRPAATERYGAQRADFQGAPEGVRCLLPRIVRPQLTWSCHRFVFL